MKRKQLYTVLFTGSLILIVLFLYLTGTIFAPELPESEIRIMQNAIASARRSHAPEYAKKEFLECMMLYDSVMKVWRDQNELWIMRRDYSKVRMLAMEATESANRASKRAIQTTGSLNGYIERNIKELEQREETFRKKFKHLPLEDEVFKRFSLANLALLEAVEHNKRGDLSGSYNRLIEAETNFVEIERETGRLLSSYFQSFSQWDRWFKQTLRESKVKKSTAIVIDKMAHKCYLIKNGDIIRQYDAEFSLKWLGNKKYQGDDATPEGLYLVIKKLDSGQTRFHKALLINYPNEADRRRYEQAVRSGAIPKSVQIGNLIEIHGDGGRGKDWTNGCIALTNNDMDHLFSMVNIGVPVTIIGSTIPLDQLLRN